MMVVDVFVYTYTAATQLLSNFRLGTTSERENCKLLKLNYTPPILNSPCSKIGRIT